MTGYYSFENDESLTKCYFYAYNRLYETPQKDDLVEINDDFFSTVNFDKKKGIKDYPNVKFGTYRMIDIMDFRGDSAANFDFKIFIMKIE